MKAGELRTPLTFQRRSKAVNAFNEQLDKWRKLHDSYGKVEPITVREFVAALAVQTEATTRILCRYSLATASIKSKDRILCFKNGRQSPPAIYDLVGPPIDKGMRHQELELLCVEHIDEG